MPHPAPRPRFVQKTAQTPTEGQTPVQKPVEPVQKPVRPPTPPRLPDGASFWLIYHAPKQEWAGSLMIGDQRFEATARTVFTLCSKLDRLYRQVAKPRTILDAVREKGIG